MFDNGNVNWSMRGGEYFCVEPGFCVSNHAFFCRTGLFVSNECYNVITFLQDDTDGLSHEHSRIKMDTKSVLRVRIIHPALICKLSIIHVEHLNSNAFNFPCTFFSCNRLLRTHTIPWNQYVATTFYAEPPMMRYVKKNVEIAKHTWYKWFRDEIRNHLSVSYRSSYICMSTRVECVGVYVFHWAALWESRLVASQIIST